MQSFPLGWQSWSPPQPNLFRLPRRDYCPVTETHLPQLDLTPNPPTKPPITYWCSWYALGARLSYSSLIRQAQIIKQYQLPVDYFLIDDGWRLSHSWLKPLITTLQHQYQLKVGLWIAPYTKHKHFHPFTLINKLVNHYHVDMLKLDFLYQPYFRPHLLDDTLPHQQLVNLFTYIRQHHPHVYTIACGSPFAPALGRVDAIRISKDTTFPPPVPRLLRRALYRHRMRLLFKKATLIPSPFPVNPDPDVRLFSLDTPTTTRQWQTISNLPNMLKGIGDDLSQLTPSQLRQLQHWLSSPH